MSEENTKQVIEINGVKMEIDMRHAKRIDHMQVGTRVKVLCKNYSDYKVKHGIIIGFEPFKKLPTIIIAVATIDYSEAKIEFIYYNSETKDIEVVVSLDDDLGGIEKDAFVKKVDREIVKKENEIQELKDRRSYFLSKFKCYWSPLEEAVSALTDDTEEL